MTVIKLIALLSLLCLSQISSRSLGSRHQKVEGDLAAPVKDEKVAEAVLEGAQKEENINVVPAAQDTPLLPPPDVNEIKIEEKTPV